MRASVAIGRAEREIMAVGARILDAARHFGEREQLRAPAAQPGAIVADWMDPVGVEQRRRGGAFDDRDAFGSLVLCQQASSQSYTVSRSPRIFAMRAASGAPGDAIASFTAICITFMT